MKTELLKIDRWRVVRYGDKYYDGTVIEHLHENPPGRNNQPAWRWMNNQYDCPRCSKCKQVPPEPILALKAFYEL